MYKILAYDIFDVEVNVYFISGIWINTQDRRCERGYMKLKNYNGMNLIKWIFGLLGLGVFLYFVLGEVILPADAPATDYRCEEFQADWVWVKPDGTRIPIEIPGKCEVEWNELVTIETTLPRQLENNTYLCFRSSKQDMEIFIDGILREEYSTEDSRLFGRTSAVAFVFLELEPEDAGKTLTVNSQSDSGYSGIFHVIYCGNRMGIWHYFFRQYGAELIVAFLTMLLGLISIIGSIIYRICYHKKIELEYLGWSVFLVAVWLIVNSVFRQLLFPNISVINDMPFYMIMLMPFPFLIYMNETQKGRYQKCYILGGIAAALSFVICTVLHVTSRIDFANTIIYMAVVCFAIIVLMGITMIIDIKKGYIKEYYLVAVGMLGASLAACAQIVKYFQRTNLFSGVEMALGLIFLLSISIISTIRDILYMERDKQQAVLQSQFKGRFLASMSHEIRTPINAVLGMDAMILRESKDMQIKEYALDIQNAGQNLLALINDILDLSKIESGKMEIVSAEYDFSSTIHDIVNMISLKAEAKGLKMKLFIDEKLPSRLWGDDVRLRQILVNLLNNAVKYTHEGEVRLTVGGTVQGNTARLQFAVSDTGIGIREEDIPKLFEEFERIEEQRNRHIEGTGLGMSITIQLLELMGSRLEVESVYGEGSKFSFELAQKIIDADPIGDLEERIRQQTEAYSYSAAFTAPDARLLMVDDNAVNRKVFVGLLKGNQVQIDMASGGEECLEYVRNNYYDVIFLDHMMPDMDGIEILHHMKEWQEYPCKDTPVIALTANAVAGAKDMYLSEGFDGFLSKPIVPEKLEQMLLDLLPPEKLVYGNQESGKMESEKTESEEMESGENTEVFSMDTTRETEFPAVDGMDWEYALLHLKEVSLLQDTVSDFYRLIDIEADTLEEYWHGIFEEKNNAEADGPEQSLELLKQYRIKVHSMKSSAGMIGAVSLSGVAKVLEYAARDGRLDILEGVTPIFLEEWRSYKERLQPCIQEEEKTVVDNYADIIEFLRILQKAAADMDVDTMDEIMEYLQQFQYPSDIQELVEHLSVAVVNLDSELAETLIPELIGKMST